MSAAFIIVVFLFLFAVVLAMIGVGFKVIESQRKKKVAEMLHNPSADITFYDTNLLNEPGERDDLLGALSELPVVKSLDRQIRQAGLEWSAIAAIAAMAIGALVGAFLGLRVPVPIFREFAMVALGCLFGSLPYLYIRRKRSKRLAEFEEQFPEALDFLARSMRAGHAFSVSLEMMADESPDPVGFEFRQVFNEQNLGAPVDVALRGLSDRIPLLDVRFFVSAVLLQRETGGNLAEILTKLSYVIRERFRLKGQVKAVSAHGRITALILSVLPVATVAALTIIAPEYLSSMAADPDGKWIIIAAITGQLLGYLWMRKIIKIKV
jgi:tight adherence protein B